MAAPASIEMIRPRWAFVELGLSYLVALAIVLFSVEVAEERWVVAFFTAGAIALCAYNTARTSSRVSTTSDGVLEVKNVLTTVYVHPEHVDRVELDRTPGLGSMARLVLRNGSSVPLRATEQPFFVTGDRLSLQIEELQVWAHLVPPPRQGSMSS